MTRDAKVYEIFRGIALECIIIIIIINFFFLFRNQQSEYLGAVWADVLAVSRCEIPSSEEISVVDSINCWLMYGSS